MIGFRYVQGKDSQHDGQPTIEIEYFAKTVSGREISGLGDEGRDDVLDAIEYDSFKERVRVAFDDIQAMIKEAYLKDLEFINLSFAIQLNLMQGWRIHTKNLILDETISFKNISEFEKFMQLHFGFKAPLRESPDDVLGTTIPGL